LSYDTAKLSNPLVSLGTGAQNASLIPNTNTAGRVGVVLGFPSGQAIAAGTRQLVTIRFDVSQNASAGQTLLTFGDQPVFREVADTGGNPVPATFQNGGITIFGTTAADVSIGGRVLTADGRGVSKAFITLTDPAGESRSAVTNPFGYYRFENLPVGQAYILTVRSKRYNNENGTAFWNPGAAANLCQRHSCMRDDKELETTIR